VRGVTVECDEKSVVDKRRLGALSPTAQSEVERHRLFFRPLLEEAREGANPQSFGRVLKKTNPRFTYRSKWPTRHRTSGRTKTRDLLDHAESLVALQAAD
jgi:hypothetical protein